MRALNRLWLRFAVWMEGFIVARLVPKRVGPVMRLVFKIPVLFYRLGLGGLIEKHILLIATTGRHTGKPRLTALEYGYNSITSSYFLISGWHGRSDWYRNALACPKVELWVGRRRIPGLAVPATDEQVAQQMELLMHSYPPVVKTWEGYSGNRYDGTHASLLRIAAAFPSLLVKTEQ